ncbi:MAG: NAD-dependent epimerase/dehydratase family protein, partial [Myxococcota bacterium]
MKIIVTGGAGFIGSHVAEAALAEGHEVVVLDDLSGGKEGNVPSGATLEPVDIRTEKAVEVITNFRPQAVFHHAAQMDVRKSVADPVF